MRERNRSPNPRPPTASATFRWRDHALDGDTFGAATIEHIVPKNHGGVDALENLSLACARCNALKGKRVDVRKANDPRLREVIERLTERRRERWRDPVT